MAVSRLAKLVSLLLVGAGFFLIYWLIPDQDDLPKHRTVGSFSMVSVHGGTYTTDNDKIKLVSFYYTNCPDICPMTMVYVGELQERLNNMGLLGEEVELVSITIDPSYDTEVVIQQFAQSFLMDGNTFGWYWLRASEEETRDVANDFQMAYQKSENGFVSHSTTMYLVDEDHHIRGIYDMATRNNPVDTEQIIEDIESLVNY